MMYARRNVLTVAVFAFVLMSARAAADPTIGVPVTPTRAAGPPVEIDECKLLYSGNEIAGQSAGVSIKFTNDSALTADIVSFAVSEGEEHVIIRDVGKFTPGVEITHHYKEGEGHQMFAPLFTHPHLDCSVALVHFANGSEWQASAAPAAAKATLSSAPASLEFGGVGNQFDEYFSVADSSDLRAMKTTGTCTGIAAVSVVGVRPRSAALRVSPIGAGKCAITITDAAQNTVVVPVSVAIGP